MVSPKYKPAKGTLRQKPFAQEILQPQLLPEALAI